MEVRGRHGIGADLRVLQIHDAYSELDLHALFGNVRLRQSNGLDGDEDGHRPLRGASDRLAVAEATRHRTGQLVRISLVLRGEVVFRRHLTLDRA